MEKLLNGKKTVLITCRQWGDTGKGKFVDRLAQWADIIIRGNGGDNCGHTICTDGQEIVLHLIPSGILYDLDGKTNIIGRGTVVYPKTLIQEIELLSSKRLTYNNLRLAYNANLITPAQILLDRIGEKAAGKGKIGSTGKGIGPAYMDFVGRQGLVINDLLNPDILHSKLKRHLEYKKLILNNYDPEAIKEIMDHEHLESGLYYDEKNIFNIDAIIDKYRSYADTLKHLIMDTDKFIKYHHLGFSNILGEGAQGDLLSVKYGTYPFVTSSDCSCHGLAEGMGIGEGDVDLSLGIIKGFYMTRVGAGPFPTEMGGERSDEWCNGGKSSRQIENDLYPNASIDDEDEFLQGVALRRAGNEYGATTGRPRRCGWLDIPLLRYVMQFNRPDIILTKLDVLNDFKTIKICTHYKYQGPPVIFKGHQALTPGVTIIEAIPSPEILKYCRPIYEEFPGWQCSLKDCRDYESLPKQLKRILDFIIDQTGIKPRIISTGPDREETIFI